ncbi:glycosyltransferase [Roseomonas eburnea]|uniref:Glycosyltransferase n=1 Tax=Neoroseomonas eburnea TaxID=1346889 RepID=A0A9X9XDD3_9PROT|nr:glycosyltransferase [Neoroseomonas eburnea]MBR0681719.1 glycosyltransferase [Neoroseomonas eburnea]
MLVSAAGLLVLDLMLPGGVPSGSARLALGGRVLPPPGATMVLDAAEAPRLVHLARLPAGAQCGAAAELGFDAGEAIAFTMPEPLPAADFAFGFAPRERQRLLRFLVGTGASAMRAAPDPDLAALCLALAVPSRAATLLARPEAGLFFWHVPTAPKGAWRLISPAGIRALRPPVGDVLVTEGAPPPGAVLLPPAPLSALRFAAAGTPAPLRAALREALAGRGTAVSLPAALAARAAEHPRLRALLQQEALLRPARTTRIEDAAGPLGAALELALSDHGGGVFLCGWLRDPLGLVERMSLLAPGLDIAVPAERLHRVARPDLAATFARAPLGGAGDRPGFLAHLAGIDPVGMAQWRLALQLRGGGAVEVTAPPGLMPPAVARDLVLRAAHPSAVEPALLDACIAPAASLLHAAALREATGSVEELAYGTAPARPRVSLIIPLYRNLRFLRFQVAAFARDPQTHGTDLVYVLDSPEQRHEVDHLLRGMATMLGLPMRLLVMPRNGGYAAACNAGAAAARAPALLFLNSDVLPAGEGWLGAMLGRLGRERRLAAVGPRLLFDDGSIQHAGLLFRRGQDEVWLNDHYCKGYPRHHAEAARPRRVPAVTGAAMLARRAAFERAGGFCTDYIVGDFEDSDLCLRFRADGGEIAYEPAAELYHFERQSIALHDGHARTLAGAVNRRLHHRRWDGAIAALMARFTEA